MMWHNEIIDLNNPHANCEIPKEYPTTVWGGVGAFQRSDLVVCGEQDSTVCRAYNVSSDSWETHRMMLTSRQGAAAVLLPNSSWWITGGSNFANPNGMKSTEIFDVDSRMSHQGRRLPLERHSHNIVKVSDNRYFLINGWPLTNRCWMYDLQRDEFLYMTPMPGGGRHSAFAAYTRHPNGEEYVVVTGGYGRETRSHRSEVKTLKSTMIFSIRSNIWWRGPDLPVALSHGQTVRVGDTFVVIGGKMENQIYSKFIYKYDQVEGKWVKLANELRDPKAGFIAVNVPEGIANCN